MQRKPDAGVNEVIASILMVALVIALVIIIGSIVFGVIVIQPKSAYIPPRVEVVNYSGQQAISLYSRGGDLAVLDKGDGVQYALGIYVENSSVSSRATPDTGVKTFGPGQTLYIYYHNGEYRVTDNLTGKIFDQLPPGPLTLRLVDENARLLVYKEGLGVGTGGGAGLEPQPVCGTITGIVYNDLNGNGQRDPGEMGLGGRTITATYQKGQNVVTLTTTSGADGVYVFSDLPVGSGEQYTIRQTEIPGSEITEPAPKKFYDKVVLNPAIKCYAEGLDFGNKQI